MIAVTGALGFIGSAVVKALNDAGKSEIDLVDRPDTSDKWRNLNGLVFNKLMTPDEFDPSEYEQIFVLGHNSSTAISFAEAVKDYRNTLDIIEKAREETRVVYASSAGTYGTDGFSFSDDVIHELLPRSPYAMGKHMIDQWAKVQGKKNVLGVKYSNVFGPGEYHKGKMASMIYQWWKMLKAGEVLPLFKPDDIDRDFIYVKDAARITVELGLRDEQTYGLANIGSGKATTFMKMQELLIEAYGETADEIDAEMVEVERLEVPEEIQFQYQMHTKLDMSNTAAKLDDASVTSMEDAVIDYVVYLKNDLRIGEPCPTE
jgi:ADP-L-glycero-D-manno-heptose 6-epimerase